MTIEQVYEMLAAGKVTVDEARAMELYLKKLEYRKEYNQRPTVKAKRAQYMKDRNERAKVGQQLLKQLVGRQRE